MQTILPQLLTTSTVPFRFSERTDFFTFWYASRVSDFQLQKFTIESRGKTKPNQRSIFILESSYHPRYSRPLIKCRAHLVFPVRPITVLHRKSGTGARRRKRSTRPESYLHYCSHRSNTSICALCCFFPRNCPRQRTEK